MTFEDETGVSDFDSNGGNFGCLTWDAPAQANAQLYINGFDINVRMLGSAYVDPASNYLLDLPNAGRVLLSLTGGNLASGGSEQYYPRGRAREPVTVGGGSADSLSMTCTAVEGIFTGKFTPPGSKTVTIF